MIQFNRETLSPPAEALVNFVKGIGGGSGGGDKRTSERFEMTKCVPIVTVDDGASPTGVPFLALTRNISTSGISFVHSEAINDKFVVVELSSDGTNRLQVLVEILRCKKNSQYFEVGGRYLRKLDAQH